MAQSVLLAWLMPVCNSPTAPLCALTGLPSLYIEHSQLEYAKRIKSTNKTGIIWEGKLKHFYQPELLFCIQE